jgi:hypothetical protein
MRLENIAWLEKEQDGKGTTYTYVLACAPRYKVLRKVGYLLSGHYHLLEGKDYLNAFKTEAELITYIEKYIMK